MRAMKNIGIAASGTLEDWPSDMVDAFIVLSNEEAKYEEAQREALKHAH